MIVVRGLLSIQFISERKENAGVLKLVNTRVGERGFLVGGRTAGLKCGQKPSVKVSSPFRSLPFDLGLTFLGNCCVPRVTRNGTGNNCVCASIFTARCFSFWGVGVHPRHMEVPRLGVE